MASLKQDVPIPLDYQLTCSLRQAIELGGWKLREQFPGESQFAEHFGISKITVRQALQRLDDLGYVRPEHSRRAFVTKAKIDEGSRELTSFIEGGAPPTADADVGDSRKLGSPCRRPSRRSAQNRARLSCFCS